MAGKHQTPPSVQKWRIWVCSSVLIQLAFVLWTAAAFTKGTGAAAVTMIMWALADLALAKYFPYRDQGR